MKHPIFKKKYKRHSHENLDDSEVFKRYQIREQHRWKLLKNATYYFLSTLAIFIVFAVFYVYTH